jgi:hypothetical protein
MSSQGVRTAGAELGLKPCWLWTWNGVAFGYRLGDSLFTHDGAEVGRFLGTEIYGVDGRYLGELGSAEAGDRLITNLYKKGRLATPFVPTFDRSYQRPRQRSEQVLYSGHENFPSPEIAKAMAFPERSSPPLLRLSTQSQ